MMETYMERFEDWLKEEKLNKDLRLELLELEKLGESGMPQIQDRFYKDLEFGTGGMRGIIGAGTNRMNVHTVAKAARGIARYINEQEGEPKSIAISYDSRNYSKEFARLCADVFIDNGIQVYIFSELMPTPLLSFAVRHFKCNGGIMITASHNPAIYNGLKVYNKDGCQATLEAAEIITKKIEEIDIFIEKSNELRPYEKKGNINWIGQEVLDAYINTVYKEAVSIECMEENLNVVYTPLNGTGNKPVRRILDKIGVGKVYVVPEQENPNGDFTTCPYPNPEKEEALAYGKKLYEKLYNEMAKDEEKPDLLLATDPDADRIGVACYKEGQVVTLSGNQVGVLLLDVICSSKTLPNRPVTIRTIVSTKMIDQIAAKYEVGVIKTLTGFKFIGEQIGKLEEKGEEGRYIFGFEESVGYLSGSYVRDKDAVNAAMLVCQMAAHYKSKGKTLFDRLEELYNEFGYFKDALLEFSFEGHLGMDKMIGIMNHFRTSFFDDFAGREIFEIIDYKKKTRRSLKTEVCCSMVSGTRPTGLPSSDVLEYILGGQASFALRPSGTEPKFKIYIGVREENEADAEAFIEKLSSTLQEIVKEATGDN